jgi:hypothetical protein
MKIFKEVIMNYFDNTRKEIGKFADLLEKIKKINEKIDECNHMIYTLNEKQKVI